MYEGYEEEMESVGSMIGSFFKKIGGLIKRFLVFIRDTFKNLIVWFREWKAKLRRRDEDKAVLKFQDMLHENYAKVAAIPKSNVVKTYRWRRSLPFLQHVSGFADATTRLCSSRLSTVRDNTNKILENIVGEVDNSEVGIASRVIERTGKQLLQPNIAKMEAHIDFEGVMLSLCSDTGVSNDKVANSILTGDFLNATKVVQVNIPLCDYADSTHLDALSEDAYETEKFEGSHLFKDIQKIGEQVKNVEEQIDTIRELFEDDVNGPATKMGKSKVKQVESAMRVSLKQTKEVSRIAANTARILPAYQLVVTRRKKAILKIYDHIQKYLGWR